ncbi:hypothetical protein ACP4OV_016048 [Aristida adscensionis]
MEVALGGANWVLDKVLNKLSDEFQAAFAASEQLGNNYNTIKTELLRAQGVLSNIKDRNLSNNRGLHDLLLQLAQVTDEADDVVDELDYFRIQDDLDGTQRASSEVSGLPGVHLHGTHAAREVRRKWFPWFSCCANPKFNDVNNGASVPQEPDMTKGGRTIPQPESKEPGMNSDSTAYKPLSFNRAEISERMGSLAERLPPLCDNVSELIKLDYFSSLPQQLAVGRVAKMRTPTTSTSIEKELYGRKEILNQTIEALCDGKSKDCPLEVLPIVGVGGIGKTTFAQHLYRNVKVKSHFKFKAWICVSLSFDVTRITREIFKSIKPKGRHHADDPYTLEQLQDEIREILKTESFLLVLDDVWNTVNEDQWKNLLAPFREDEAKVRVVLVTTRFPIIEEMVKEKPDDKSVELKGLECEEYEELFFKCALDGQREGHGALVHIGKEIAGKLRGSPLAAKIVGRLLKRNLTWQYWSAVLESKEWAYQTNDNDIMPALKLTYDHLPLNLQQCFLYCALFPDDYQFSSLELVSLWMSAGLLDASDQNTRIQTLGQEFLNELLDNGVVQRVDEENRDTVYILHDLFTELARSLSSHKFLCIAYPFYRLSHIPTSICHLSIIIPEKQGSYGDSFKCDDTFKEEMEKLKKEVDIKNLRTLMLFGEYDEDFASVFQDTFNEIESIRVIRLFKNSVEYLPQNFPKLLHLRYLGIKPVLHNAMFLPNNLLNMVSRFYHLKVLYLQDCYDDLPKDFSRLVNLRHLVTSSFSHSSIAELGGLTELGGILSIYHLEKAKGREEASKAKLVSKRKLTGLKLCRDAKRSNIKQTEEREVLEGLQPNFSLSELHIENHGDTTCPKWLGSQMSVKNLKLLHLNAVSWNTFPHFSRMTQLEELKLRKLDVCSLEGTVFGHIEHETFTYNLVILDICDMANLEKWNGANDNCLFPSLEELRIERCPKLTSLPSGNSKCCPKLHTLYISSCPLLSLPMPCTPTLQCVEFDKLDKQDSLVYSDKQLTLRGKNKRLAYHNLEKLERLTVVQSSPVSPKDLKMLTSLQTLLFYSCSNVILEEEDDCAFHLPAVQVLILHECGPTGKELERLLGCFPALSYMQLKHCYNTGCNDDLLLISFKKSCATGLWNLWAHAT